MSSALEYDAASRWYGDRVALADVTVSFPAGVTGLLGANGAGKSTALGLAAGLIAPSAGQVRLLGADPRTTPAVLGRLGYVPSADGLFDFLTAREHVRAMAELRGVADAGAAADAALARVDLVAAADRRVTGFSKGMRQAVKLAGALVHDPELLLLDEPLNGLDPPRRRYVVELVRALGAEGRTVVVSSHVLEEVERMAQRVVVLVDGRLVADGDTAELRALLAERPRAVRIDAGDATPRLVQALIGDDLVVAVRLDHGSAVIDTPDAQRLARALPRLAQREAITLRRVEPVGDDLGSVYAFLQQRARGAGA